MPVRSVNPRSSLVFDVQTIARQTGHSMQVRREVAAPDGLGITMIGVQPQSPIALEIIFESVVEGVLATGTADFTLTGNCACCLDEIEYPDSTNFQELYCYPEKEIDDPDARHLVDDLVDLEPLLRDLVVTDLPFTVKCRDDCAGLCTKCGTNLNHDPSHSHGADGDPRWEALASLDGLLLASDKDETTNKE
ncbi:MAG: DUF177 domain-containing protein [Propionibacteriaceae bacterium]|nr:DUF177 domain-containing protein [Propionibacteriaceae bacterium]